MENKIKKFILINAGLLIMTFGLHFFLISANLAAGGVTGAAMVINHYIPTLEIGLIMAVFNIILFIIAFIIIGKDFTGYTLYCSFMLSGLIYLLEAVAPMSQGLSDDMMINLLFGIVINGVGMAIIFYQNASTGGTDIIAKIVNKFLHIEIGKSLLIADLFVVFAAIIAFGITKGLYAMLGVIINGMVIDRIIAGFGMKLKVVIISEFHEEINQFINFSLERGTTLYLAQGGFTGSQKVVIHCLLEKKQYILLKQALKRIDPLAFSSVSFSHEVLGEGFGTVS
ncbi:MAG: YitT family protein [Clostridia bacterium]|nr:YitT family protein [Clostridia bacterium]